jgi:hypothetical protein
MEKPTTAEGEENPMLCTPPASAGKQAKQLARERGGPLQLPDQPLESVTRPVGLGDPEPHGHVGLGDPDPRGRSRDGFLEENYASTMPQSSGKKQIKVAGQSHWGGGPDQIRSEKLENGSLNR